MPTWEEMERQKRRDRDQRRKDLEAIPDPTENPGGGDDTARQLLDGHFCGLKNGCTDLEILIAVLTERPAEYGLTEKDLKRLDKAVTVMKVGMKIVKKVARREQKRAARVPADQ